MRDRLLACSPALALLLLSACATEPRVGGRYAGGPAYPFAPASLHIHALTHVEPGPDGAPILLCYVELLDRFGDGVKGAGTVTVELRQPGERDAAAADPTFWNIDLADLAVNARTFDRATRLYRFQLADVPAWAAGSPRPRAAVRVRMAVLGAGGEDRLLEDEYELAR